MPEFHNDCVRFINPNIKRGEQTDVAHTLTDTTTKCSPNGILMWGESYGLSSSVSG